MWYWEGRMELDFSHANGGDENWYKHFKIHLTISSKDELI